MADNRLILLEAVATAARAYRAAEIEESKLLWSRGIDEAHRPGIVQQTKDARKALDDALATLERSDG